MVSKECRPKDDDTDFDEDNEVSILKSSFIDLKNNNKSYICIVWMCDHYYIIWLSMLGDDEDSRVAAEGISVLVFWYLVGF